MNKINELEFVFAMKFRLLHCFAVLTFAGAVLCASRPYMAESKDRRIEASLVRLDVKCHYSENLILLLPERIVYVNLRGSRATSNDLQLIQELDGLLTIKLESVHINSKLLRFIPSRAEVILYQAEVSHDMAAAFSDSNIAEVVFVDCKIEDKPRSILEAAFPVQGNRDGVIWMKKKVRTTSPSKRTTGWLTA